MSTDGLKVQGTKINYYFICKRKLWLFSKGITMENTSDRVLSGKIIHETSYPRKKYKDVLVDDLIRIDIIEGDTIREVKLSSKMPEADIMQIKYYLFYLRQKGIEKTGIINYIKERRQDNISLTSEDEERLKQVLEDIIKIEGMDKPPDLIKLSWCKKWAYYEFCYSGEVEE